MKTRYVERKDFIETSDPNPVYRVTFTGGSDLQDPWANTEAEHEISEVSSVLELIDWIANNAHGREAEAWVKAWNVDDEGQPYECLLQLM